MAAAEHMRGVGGEVGRGKYQPRSHKQRRRRRRRCDRRASKRLLTWQAAAVAARKGHAVLLPPGGGRAQQRCLLGGSLPRELPQFWRAHRTAVSIRIHAARMAEPVSGPWAVRQLRPDRRTAAAGAARLGCVGIGVGVERCGACRVWAREWWPSGVSNWAPRPPFPASSYLRLRARRALLLLLAPQQAVPLRAHLPTLLVIMVAG